MLTSLNLIGGSIWCAHPNALRSILSYCISLLSLRCQVPMQTVHNSGMELSSRVSRSVSPRELTRVFQPVHKTLRKLTLLNNRWDVPYDGSHMDLSSFVTLEDLEITSCCLFPPGSPLMGRNRVCMLLPKSLRHLKLCFRVLACQKRIELTCLADLLPSRVRYLLPPRGRRYIFKPGSRSRSLFSIPLDTGAG
jgi:hypothetical protein